MMAAHAAIVNSNPSIKWTARGAVRIGGPFRPPERDTYSS
jgi:hypothetical protein